MNWKISLGVLDPRRPSLSRGTILVLGSLFLALHLAGFPDARPSFGILVPLAIAALGSFDTMRCLQRHWNFYHAAVMVLLYMDIMALSMILFLLIYPFERWVVHPII